MIRLESIDGPAVRVGLVAAAPVALAPARAPLLEEIAACAERLRARYGDSPQAAGDALAPARALYRAFGIDPTKTRPSSEALLRRVLRRRPLPCILDAVDLANLLALRFLLPIGLYDAERIDPPVRLRRGAPGEAYVGVRQSEVHLAGRPVLADRRGPFGNPTADSARTAVSTVTRSLWLVVWAPGSYAVARLAAHVEHARSAIERHLAPAGEPVRTSGDVQ